MSTQTDPQITQTHNVDDSKKINKKKKKGDQEKPLLDDQQINLLLQQKFNEIQQQAQNSETAELKKIRKQYKRIEKQVQELIQNKTLSPQEKQQILNKEFSNIIDLAYDFEENAIIAKKLYTQFKVQKDQFYQENLRIQNAKEKFSSGCKEIQKQNEHLIETNKSMVDEEEKRRTDLVENFEKSINEITSKINNPNEDGEDIFAKNENLKVDMDELIKKYESREKEFMDSLGEQETKVKEKNQDLLQKIKVIESEAKEAQKYQQKLQKLMSEEQEKKLKIVIYSQKVEEYTDTMEKTHETLEKYKIEFLKLSQRLHQENQQLTVLRKDESEADKNLFSIYEKIEELTKQNEALKKDKEVKKSFVVEKQNKLKSLQ